MPQKKNPDLFELIRAKVVGMAALEMKVRGVTHGLSSGYSKDLQEVKEPVMEAFQTVQQTLDVLNAVIPDMAPNEPRLEESMSPELFAAHRAYEMVKEGVSFRQAYRQVKEELHLLKNVQAKQAIREMTHIGGTGNLQLDELGLEIDGLANKWSTRRRELTEAWEMLFDLEK